MMRWGTSGRWVNSNAETDSAHSCNITSHSQASFGFCLDNIWMFLVSAKRSETHWKRWESGFMGSLEECSNLWRGLRRKSRLRIKKKTCHKIPIHLTVQTIFKKACVSPDCQLTSEKFGVWGEGPYRSHGELWSDEQLPYIFKHQLAGNKSVSRSIWCYLTAVCWYRKCMCFSFTEIPFGELSEQSGPERRGEEFAEHLRENSGKAPGEGAGARGSTGWKPNAETSGNPKLFLQISKDFQTSAAADSKLQRSTNWGEKLVISWQSNRMRGDKEDPWHCTPAAKHTDSSREELLCKSLS